MADRFAEYPPTSSEPATRPFAVVPHDTVALRQIPFGIYVGTGGDVTLRGVHASEDVTYRNLPDASYLNVRAEFVRATGTTASDLIGEF